MDNYHSPRQAGKDASRAVAMDVTYLRSPAGGGLSSQQRRGNYERQNGSARLTPRQVRRLNRKARHAYAPFEPIDGTGP